MLIRRKHLGKTPKMNQASVENVQASAENLGHRSEQVKNARVDDQRWIGRKRKKRSRLRHSGDCVWGCFEWVQLCAGAWTLVWDFACLLALHTGAIPVQSVSGAG